MFGKQTILGAGGIIAVELAKSLKSYTSDIRLVSRTPKKVNETDELFSVDLLKAEQLERAIEGSSVAYITIGFPYSYKVWKESWPILMKNAINACQGHQCKLVFFDNIYMYDQDHLNGMTEDTPIKPASKKGEIRADIANMLKKEVEAGNVTALIARCADYYGPAITRNSVLNETVVKNLYQNKTANWLCSLDFQHSFTYTPDAGKATALLGITDDAYGEVWHLPTAHNPPTGKRWIEMIARELKVEPKSRVASRWMIKLMGLFTPELKETYEMMYQYDRHYVFDSSKFERRFGMRPTSYEEGIKEMISKDYGV